MSTLSEILSRPAKDFKAPPVLPMGQYMGVIRGQPKVIESSKKTPGYEFTIVLTQALGDVDQTALADAGGAANKELNFRVYISDASGFFLKQFCEHAGIEPGEKSLGEMVAETPGKTIGVHITNQPSKDGSRMVHYPDSTFKV